MQPFTSSWMGRGEEREGRSLTSLVLQTRKARHKQNELIGSISPKRKRHRKAEKAQTLVIGYSHRSFFTARAGETRVKSLMCLRWRALNTPGSPDSRRLRPV